jgi:hypothetical protein
MNPEQDNDHEQQDIRAKRLLGELALLTTGITLSAGAIEVVTNLLGKPLDLPIAVAIATASNVSIHLSRRHHS